MLQNIESHDQLSIAISALSTRRQINCDWLARPPTFNCLATSLLLTISRSVRLKTRKRKKCFIRDLIKPDKQAFQKIIKTKNGAISS